MLMFAVINKNYRMNKEIAQYICTYFSHLLSAADKHDSQLLSYQFPTFKPELQPLNTEKLIIVYEQNGWTTENINDLNLLSYGDKNFHIRKAAKILIEANDKVYFNKCPKCHQLTRTPYAKQCRFCKYDWHDIIITPSV